MNFELICAPTHASGFFFHFNLVQLQISIFCNVNLVPVQLENLFKAELHEKRIGKKTRLLGSRLYRIRKRIYVRLKAI